MTDRTAEELQEELRDLDRKVASLTQQLEVAQDRRQRIASALGEWAPESREHRVGEPQKSIGDRGDVVIG